MHVKRIAAFLLSLVLSAGLFTGCGGNAEKPEETPAEGETTGGYQETLIYAMSTSPTNTNPMASNLVQEKQMFQMTHDTLVFYGRDGQIEPGLAESWDVIDASNFVFHLRKGAKFHNGEEVKASDVVYSLNLAKESPVAAVLVTDIQDVVAEDDYTVKVTLAKPNVDFLSLMYDSRASIVSEKACTELGIDEGAMIGSGPYKIVETIAQDHTTIERYDDAWEADKCPTKRFIFRAIPEDSARLIALQTGEVDIVNAPPAIEFDHIREDENLTLHQIPGEGSVYMGFNMDDPVVSNKLVRQAIAHAVDRDELVMIVANGDGIPTTTWWASSLDSRYDGYEGHDYDPEKAKELLAEAGYPDGIDLRISCTKKQKNVAELLQSQFKKVGINLSLDEVDTSAFASYLASGQHQMWNWNYSFGSYPDAMRNAYYTGSTGSQRAHYSNARVDELFELGAGETDEAKRNEYYKEIQEIVADECPIIPFYYAYKNVAAKASVEDCFFRPDGHHTYKYCFIAE